MNKAKILYNTNNLKTRKHIMKHTTTFTLLTFYKFVHVENIEEEVRDHLWFCQDIWMKGRIYIGREGISATLTWNEWQIRAYKMYLDNHPLFNNPEDFDIKATQVDEHKFEKMIVKEKEEIVELGKQYTPEEIEEAWNRMNIEDFKDLMENGNPDEYVILDMRNNHEYSLGHFDWAIPANTLNFRELDKHIDEYKEQFWDKKIISYCTWWIRCEKSTVMLQKAGLKNIYQLQGGVVKYINTYNDGKWLGNLYVFDDRVSDMVGDENTHTTIWECIYSWEKTNNCENCRYSPCNARIIADPKEYTKHFWLCSEECFEKAKEDTLIKETKFDSMNYKMERAKVKINPECKEEVYQNIKKYLERKLRLVEFTNKESLKEDFIMD